MAAHKSRIWVEVHDLMQRDYKYQLIAKTGEEFDPAFAPFFTPQQMLELGVFEGKYMNDCRAEFPDEWFENAKINDTPDPDLNYFSIKSRQPLSVWQNKGWIIGPDPRGWFQWYCRYYQGRRIPEIDSHQIKRWKAFSRHAGQIKANCAPGDLGCRPRQRQALLQWSYDPFI
ncbi:MAG: hypothetical protein MRY79_01715 [Alphaproteobacteria bacterium]|nr:hypothetical protein [Alphaproteobacteria bacterium]